MRAVVRHDIVCLSHWNMQRYASCMQNKKIKILYFIQATSWKKYPQAFLVLTVNVSTPCDSPGGQNVLANVCVSVRILKILFFTYQAIASAVQRALELLIFCWSSHLPSPEPPAPTSSRKRAWPRSPVFLPEWPTFGSSRAAARGHWTPWLLWWGTGPPGRRWLTPFSTSWQLCGFRTRHRCPGCWAPQVWPRTTGAVWSCGRQTSGPGGQVQPLKNKISPQ